MCVCARTKFNVFSSSFTRESLNSHCSHAVTTYIHNLQLPIESLIPSRRSDRLVVVVSKISYHSIECMKNLTFHTPEKKNKHKMNDAHQASVLAGIFTGISSEKEGI